MLLILGIQLQASPTLFKKKGSVVLLLITLLPLPYIGGESSDRAGM